MKYLSTFVLSFFIFVLFTPFKVSAQETYGADTRPFPKQLIIKYKSGQSENDLMKVISERNKSSESGILPTIKIVFSDLALKINGKETPELQLYQLLEAEKQAGVYLKEELFKEDSSLQNYYQIKLDEKADLAKAVSIFRSLSEVEFAEADWLSGGGEYK